MENCCLCAEPLSKGRTNLEHFVPATVLRNLSKLCVPSHLNWALRFDPVNRDAVLARRSNSKEFCVVRVHEICNSRESIMCRDLKYIIDHLEPNIPQDKIDRILTYYAMIWEMDKSDLSLRILSPAEVDELKSDCWKIYQPGMMWIGRILIYTNNSTSLHNEEKHTVYLGTETALEKLIDRL